MQNRNNNPKTIYDLTKPLSEHTPVFPGDPVFVRNQVCSVANGDHYTLHSLCFSNHAGTHIDFPLHVFEKGKTSSDFSLSELSGPGLIIECCDPKGKVTLEFIQQYVIDIGDFVFLKNATYLEITAAEFLVQRGVKIVGIDSLSIDNITDHTLPIHNLLLSNNILIVESLCLDEVDAGQGEFLIAPLKVSNIDGVPARVVMWR